MFDFRQATLFCLEYRLLKNKITRYAKTLERAWLPAHPVYAYDR